MGLFDSIKGMFSKVQDTRDQVDDVLKQADSITDMIPGDADDKMLDGLKTQVENVTDKYDAVAGSLSGNEKK